MLIFSIKQNVVICTEHRASLMKVVLKYRVYYGAAQGIGSCNHGVSLPDG